MRRLGVILAGGLGTRLADGPPSGVSPSGVSLNGVPSNHVSVPKPWAMLGEKTLLQHSYDLLAPQVDEVVFSVSESFQEANLLGCKTVPDIKTNPVSKQGAERRPARQSGGPLVAIASALKYAHALEGAKVRTEIVTVPADMPFLPPTFVAHLASPPHAPEQPRFAFCAGRDYPTCAIWPVSLAPQLMEWVESEDMRAIYKALRRCDALKVTFDKNRPNDFLNINSPQDFQKAQTLIETGFGEG